MSGREDDLGGIPDADVDVGPDPVAFDPDTLAELSPDPTALAAIEAEEALAARRRSAIEAGRRKGGIAGAAMAGVMLGLRDIYEGPPKEDDIVIVAEAPGDPEDIDTDGISGRVDDIDYWAPPPPGIDRP